VFANRVDAGRALGERLALCHDLIGAVVVALPRGGVPVAAQVARRLCAPLVVMPVGKVGAPGREELALGAVALGGVKVLNRDVIEALHLDDDDVDELVAKAVAKVAQQAELYKRLSHGASFRGRPVVVVDDGLATGASMRASLIAVREQSPRRVVLAVPVASPEALASLAPLVDEEVCVVQPESMQAVGAWYEDFSQTTDAEVAGFLAELGSS
jgi:predicted phosphoribosyltransferase